MRTIYISDISLAKNAEKEKSLLTFREQIELAKLLDKTGVSVIELGDLTADTKHCLLIKSIVSSVESSTVAVCPGFEENNIKAVWNALKDAKSTRLQVCAGVSTARMEYVYHKKASDMIECSVNAVKKCLELCNEVEFIADDATRADFDYLCSIIRRVIEAGASIITVCDTASKMLPDELGDFIDRLNIAVPELKKVRLGLRCSNAIKVADASAVTAIKKGVDEIKVTALQSDAISFDGLARILSLKSEELGVSCGIRNTELMRILVDIQRLCSKTDDEVRTPFEDGVREETQEMFFSASDNFDDVMKAVEGLGYDLDNADKSRIWKVFRNVAQKKDQIGLNELEAIIASEAMQVPATYVLKNYVIISGNEIDVNAHIKLKKGNKFYDGLAIGDGPIDAAFLAIENITGHHYELDDFQIKAVTEGHEAMGQTIVKLRSGGKIYSGRGLSTDIIGSGIAAYINALNKIIYEEKN